MLLTFFSLTTIKRMHVNVHMWLQQTSKRTNQDIKHAFIVSRVHAKKNNSFSVQSYKSRFQQNCHLCINKLHLLTSSHCYKHSDLPKIVLYTYNYVHEHALKQIFGVCWDREYESGSWIWSLVSLCIVQPKLAYMYK